MLKDLPDESVDLCYIDPPFNSNRNYETFWGDVAEKRAFNDRFGDAQEYINYMRPRVTEIYRVMKKTGSFYYHCDWHASHYVKIMLDEIFGFNNFENEIIWHYKRWPIKQKAFQRMHDVIFFYTKTNDENRIFNTILGERSESTLRRWKDKKIVARHDENGMRIPSVSEENKSEGVPLDDVWNIPIIAPSAKERLGYPTQKPLALIERIVNASSNKGDVILDAFCGCGTTLVAAQKLNRKWIGVDISPTACRVMSQRLYELYKLREGKDFWVDDLPKTEEELRILPHFEFQNWAVIALGQLTNMSGIPNKIKSGDFGIDGKLYPVELEKKKKEEKDLFGDTDKYYPVQVKQMDKVGRPDIDSFQTAIRRDGRIKGYFVSFDFTKDAMTEIRRLDKDGEIEIVPITVSSLLRAEQYKH
jgi:DNA modification methylase